jgi:hypothetical protein
MQMIIRLVQYDKMRLAAKRTSQDDETIDKMHQTP